MIVFDLTCGNQHRFEGWFASGEDFTSQQSRALVGCPVCASTDIAKLPSSKIKRAEVAKPAAAQVPVDANKQQVIAGNPEQRAQMMALIDQVLQNSENVGERFAEEARRIHYKESPERAIRGQASAEQTRELLEEGIPVLPLPVPPQNDWH
jgi:hypothetical protein